LCFLCFFVAKSAKDPLLNPPHWIANSYLAVIQDFTERTASPWLFHRISKTGKSLLHPLARPRLTEDAYPATAHLQDAPPAVREAEIRHHQVGTSSLRRQRSIQPSHHQVPDLLLDDRHLALAALVGVPRDSVASHKLDGVDRVHRTAFHSFDPNSSKLAIHNYK